MHPLEPTTTMMYDVSRFQTLFVVADEDEDAPKEGEEEEMNDLICHVSQEMYDEELALEREEQEFEERNLGNLECPKAGLQSFACRSCSECFTSRKELNAHRRQQHRRQRQGKPAPELTCEICGKLFQRHNALVDHMNSHTDRRNFSCPECPARFVQRGNRDRHVRDTHLKEYLFSCPEADCDRRFQQRRERDQHVKTVHRRERDLVCSLCQATFSHPVNYKKHLASHSSIKPFSCHICKKLFGRQENRDVHLFVHSLCKAYVCSVCGADYMRRQQLIRHSAASGHVNDKIVRQKPQFSAAFAQKEGKGESKEGEKTNQSRYLLEEEVEEDSLEVKEEQAEFEWEKGKLMGENENED
ncbi:hypothetical protein KR054_009013 [Drosophila jambulina]|nr:hypothetical protein KR054_009013 [Drosophila jambulina]